MKENVTNEYKRALDPNKTGSKPRLTNEEFLKKLKIVKPNYEALEPYVKSQVKIKFNCKTCDHEPFYATPNNMLKESYGGCPDCGNKSRRDTKRTKSGIGIKNLEKRIIEKYPDGLYRLVEGQKYTNNKESYWIHCNKCKENFKISPVNLLRKDRPRGCPTCNSIRNDSRGVKTIIAFLEKYNLDYTREVTFPNCEYKRPLRFDFKVYKNEQDFILIEFDGELHERGFNGKDDEEFLETQIRDNIKNEYCKNNNLRLLRISRHQFKDIENILLEEFNLV
jgi:Zn finger protein HypA/HybF involved in hydrogenase expression